MHLDNVVDSGGSRRQVLTQATRCWSGQHSHWGMSICRTGACASVVVRTLKRAGVCNVSGKPKAEFAAPVQLYRRSEG